MREVDERFENVIWDECSTVDTLTWLREENCASSNGHLFYFEGGLKWLLGWLWALFQEKDLTNLQNCRNGPKKVPQSSHLSVGRGLIAIWAMEGDFYNGASLRWHSMILDDIWWYWIVNIYLNIGIFKFVFVHRMRGIFIWKCKIFPIKVSILITSILNIFLR